MLSSPPAAYSRLAAAGEVSVGALMRVCTLTALILVAAEASLLQFLPNFGQKPGGRCQAKIEPPAFGRNWFGSTTKLHRFWFDFGFSAPSVSRGTPQGIIFGTFFVIFQKHQI